MNLQAVFYTLFKDHDHKLRNENDRYQCNGVSCGICRGDILRSSSADKRAERRRGSHSARDRAEIVQQAEFQHVFRENKAKNQRNKRHYYSIEEVDRLEILHELRAA